MKDFGSLSKVEQLAFPGAKTNYQDLPELSNSETIWLTSTDNDGDWISGFLALGEADNKECLIHFYGQHENLRTCEYFIDAVRSSGKSIAVFDYRGYGVSRGRPKEQAFYADALLIYDSLKEQHPEYQISASGRGVGTAVAVYLAQHRELEGLILFSPPTSMLDVVSHVFEQDQVIIEEAMPFQFDNLDRIRKIACPILLVHGTEDVTIPYWMNQRLKTAVRSPLTCVDVPGAGFEDLFTLGGHKVWESMFEFMDSRWHGQSPGTESSDKQLSG